MSRILSARTRHLMDLSKTLSLESFDDAVPAAVVVEPEQQIVSMEAVSTDAADVEAAEKKVGFSFTKTYVAFLMKHGKTHADSQEFYGVGKGAGHLDAVKEFHELKSRKGYPAKAMPLTAAGDGHTYTVYDNATGLIQNWTDDGVADQKFGKSLDAWVASLESMSDESLNVSNDIPAEPIVAAEDNQVVSEEGIKGAVVGTLLAGPVGGVAGHFLQEHASKKEAEKKAAREKMIRENERNKTIVEHAATKNFSIDTEHPTVSEEGVVGGAALGAIAGSIVGPAGALVGGVAGGVIGHMRKTAAKHEEEEKTAKEEEEIRAHERAKVKAEMAAGHVKASTEDSEVIDPVVSDEGVVGAVTGAVAGGIAGIAASHSLPIAVASAIAGGVIGHKTIPEKDRQKKAAAADKPAVEDVTPTDPVAVAEVAVDPVDPVAPSEAPMIDEVDGVQDAIRDVNDSHQVIDELSEAAAGMEAIVASMEASLADGGLTPQASVFANLAINAHTHRVGYHRPVVASMESFGGLNTREQATTISCESAKEVIEKIWAAIKSALAAAWKAITEFYKRIFNEARRVKASAKSLYKHVEELDGAPKKGEFELGDLAKRIAVGGKVPDNLAAGILSAHKAIDGVLTGFAEQAAKYTAEIRAVVVAAATASEDTFEDKLKKLTSIHVPLPAGMSATKAAGGGKEYTSAALPGDMVFVAHIPETNEDPIEHVRALAAVKLEVRSDVGYETTTEIKRKVEPKGWMMTTLNNVVGLCDTMLDAERHLEANRKVLNDEAKSIKDDIADKVPEKHAMAFKNLLQSYGRAISAADRIPTAVLGYGVQVSKAYLALVAKSAACYKEESKPEAAAA